jgi:DNA-binding IclR family transcriptional regulator
MEALSGSTRRGTGSLGKALRLLTEIGSAEPDTLRLTELVSRTNIESSTAYRMLACLADSGFVEKVEGKRYRLGQRVFELGLAAGQHYRDHAAARPTLRRLACMLNAPVTLDMRSGIETVFIEREGPELFGGVKAAIGMRLPIGVASGGVALLAAMHPGEADAAIRANERRYRLYGRDTSQRLRRHVDRARVDGYARTHGIMRPDIGGLGIVVPGLGGGPTFALSLLCDVDRLSDSRALAQEMDEAARQVAAAIAAARQTGPQQCEEPWAGAPLDTEVTAGAAPRPEPHAGAPWRPPAQIDPRTDRQH